ncbi:hypothetical protein ACWDMR_22150 [Streptomyces althioticus]|uniref:hypothetical protein n=1 Tax=Streptomyces althioticus TaxID=83380 RepID=UPI0036D019FC
MTDDWRKDRIGAAPRGDNPTVTRRLDAGFAAIGDVRSRAAIGDGPGLLRAPE